MTTNTLISAQALRDLVDSHATIALLETSFDLADTQAGERGYQEGHIPGAQYMHLDRDLSAPKTGQNGRHPLPSRESFAARIGALGIAPQTQVVVYDRQGAMYAVRAWWMLRWLGHDAVAVLDGGVAAWQAAGGSLDAILPTRGPLAPYPLQAPLVSTIDANALGTQLGRVRLVDARAPERFRGEVEPLDAQAGHIPGASNRFFKDNLAADGRFKSPEQLKAEWTPLLAGGAPVIHQCGSGVTACHNLFAMELAGLGTSTLYPGSWSEWSSDPSRPIAKA